MQKRKAEVEEDIPVRQEAAQSPEAFTEVHRTQEPANGHLPNGAAPAAPPEQGEKSTGTLHHQALQLSLQVLTGVRIHADARHDEMHSGAFLAATERGGELHACAGLITSGGGHDMAGGLHAQSPAPATCHLPPRRAVLADVRCQPRRTSLCAIFPTA